MKKGIISTIAVFLITGSAWSTGLNSGEWMFTAEGNNIFGSDITLINPDDRAGDNLSSEDQLNLANNQAWFDGLETTTMTFEEAIASWLGITPDTLSIYDYANIEEPDTYAGDAMQIDYNSGGKAGSWTTTLEPDTTGPAINYYVVKGGNEFAMYWVDPAASEGTWSTENLLNGSGKKTPAMSHFSAYTTAPVPEPATFLLMTFGLLGVGMLKKRKR